MQGVKAGDVCFCFFKKIFIYLATSGLSCGVQTLPCTAGVQAQLPHRLSCCAACGIPRPGIKSVSPGLEGGFLITGPAGRFLKLGDIWYLGLGGVLVLVAVWEWDNGWDSVFG